METKNYWRGYNEYEDFSILLCAKSKEEAALLAKDYAKDACLEGAFELFYYEIAKGFSYLYFDCDYVIEDTSGKEDVRYIRDIYKEYYDELEK